MPSRSNNLPPPTGPLPDPCDRAYVPDVSRKYSIPEQTIYDMLRSGELPVWKIGVRRICTSWPAVRAFFGDGGRG